MVKGECGACSVFVNNLLQKTVAFIPIGSIAGADIQTIEGIIETEQFKILDESYSIAGGSAMRLLHTGNDYGKCSFVI